MELSREWAAEAYWYMAASYVRLGRLDEARVAVKKYLELVPKETVATARAYFSRQPYKDPDVGERELADLAQGGLPDK